MWYHVAVVHDDSESYTTLYLDGVVDGGGTQTVSGDTSDIHIGDDTAGAKTFNGLIDEVRIYSTALTAAQIQQHYAEGLARHKDLAIYPVK